MTTAIELSHVTKTYPRKRCFQHFWQTLIHSQYERHEALHDMSFTVPRNFLGGGASPVELVHPAYSSGHHYRGHCALFVNLPVFRNINNLYHKPH